MPRRCNTCDKTSRCIQQAQVMGYGFGDCPDWQQKIYPAVPHIQPPAPTCSTCKHEGKSLEDWPCRVSMNAAGLTCYEPKEAHNGTAST